MPSSPAGPVAPRLPRALAALALGAAAGCSAFRLPAQADPDPARHTYTIEGQVRRQETLAAVPGARLAVHGAASVIGDAVTDPTGAFWIQVAGIEPFERDPSGSRGGPAGFVVLSASAAGGCVPETRVSLPAAGPVLLVLGECPR